MLRRSMPAVFTPPGYSIRTIAEHEIAPWLECVEASLAENGSDGIYWAPFSRGDLTSRRTTERLERTREQLRRSISEPGWRRAWAIVQDQTGAFVGEASLEGCSVAAGLHRCTLGIAVRREHHRRGLGRALLATLIAWAHEQPSLVWMDLGVFGGNAPAQRLYEALGFQVVGRRDDAYRPDGHSVTDIEMVLKLHRSGTP
jgi:RimJ/RimL family protein N-acetyltransferase